MAKKISQLTQATEVKSDDVTVIVQDGETKKLPLNMMVTKQDIENKKIAGLAKLDEIEATYENDTYTPTITVKNKSSVKTGEGDEVDYSANVMDGHVKSAILTGQTLVSLCKIPSKFVTMTNTASSINLIITHNLQPDKKYAIIGEISEINAPNGGLCTWVTHADGTEAYEMKRVANAGKFFFTYNVTKEIKTFRLYIHGDDRDNGGTITIGNLMLLEYQDGMENWDIPYFEGMQSVKMPVLTTTGKNLFDLRRMNESGYIGNNALNEINLEENSVATTNRNSVSTGRGYVITGLKIGVPYTITATLDESSNTTGYFQIGNRQGTGHYEQRQYFTPGQTKSWKVYSDVGSLRLAIAVASDVSNQYIKFKNIQIEEGSTATSYEPYKSNILTVNEDIELRGIGDVQDELDLLTGEVVERVGEVVLDGSEDWVLYEHNMPSVIGFYTSFALPNVLPALSDSQRRMVLSDTFIFKNQSLTNDEEFAFISNTGKLNLNIKRSKLSDISVTGFKSYLASNPLTIQCQLATESIKTVDLMPSGTHPSTTPYCWKNGHIQLSSSGLLPNLEYSVVTSRAGQINQNATMIVKNDKRIFDLEILLAGGLVNTTYQALTLQNQVETGLSKVSLNSETEPDYLLYHMIMKLIEEKAYKLDDLTEKVSVFYLYEKLSDEQFETIYSALYPFVEDEIVEEPVVEELPEVVEDEVIM